MSVYFEESPGCVGPRCFECALKLGQLFGKYPMVKPTSLRGREKPFLPAVLLADPRNQVTVTDETAKRLVRVLSIVSRGSIPNYEHPCLARVASTSMTLVVRSRKPRIVTFASCSWRL
jgi:hypothetical protein